MDKNKSEEMTFLEHLEELRWHIVRSLISIIFFTVIALFGYDFIFNEVILRPQMQDFFTNRKLFELGEWLVQKYGFGESIQINNVPINFINIEMAGQFMLHIKVSIFAGVIMSFPYIMFELWRFIRPALHHSERVHASGAVFFSSILFFTGVLFGYYIITPLSVHFLSSYTVSDAIINQINMKSYISTVTSISLAAGIMFELPIIVYFLSKVGIISPQFMRTYRKHAIILFLLFSAMITPPDIFSQVFVCVPLLLLYELSIYLCKIVTRKKVTTEIIEQS